MNRRFWLASIMATGFVTLILAKADHFFRHPELTEPQAFAAYWLYWLVGTICILFGFSAITLKQSATNHRKPQQ